ncbi:3-phosphoshikimate 1-carboxyvinyltransferase [Sodalis sp. CWE]|uniref:3-phosphoshikimate 1-carboxyvinyltransferase n=1 Tax=Sodalis sp. CWE TaxID=2803816 RepID=UPI001C7D642C|nr:3-phosphoshikimate 1-carboxyvinyltransferase [Sodalis sp. CWE]MBX4181139.1 3-phosphoshikimate 1-carboxyvinyltransferase [Sodalis sp. CWE]
MKSTLTLNAIKFVNGAIDLPGSKSISNRALLLAAQAQGTTCLKNLSNSDDIRYMLKALSQLGVNYRLSKNHRNCEIDGLGGPLFSKSKPTLFLGNAGTAMRSLTAALSLRKQDIILTGEPRMKERPIGHLIDALRQGMARIEYIKKNHYPPIRLLGGYQGGDITIDGSISSQFLTALLMMAPMAKKSGRIFVLGKLVSRPYVDITLSLMRNFGVEIPHDNHKIYYIPGGKIYQSPGNYLIEGDASSASYFLAAAAIRGGTVRVIGVDQSSIQGDIYFAKILEKMGAIIRFGKNYIECSRSELNAINMDMNHIPDAAMTVAVTALFAKGGTTMIRNIANWRVKETNRLTAMAKELRKVGAIVYEGRDYISVTPPAKLVTARIQTYNDHRMAMSFSLIAMSDIPVTILNPQCTHKTFPDFFVKLATLTTSIATTQIELDS